MQRVLGLVLIAAHLGAGHDPNANRRPKRDASKASAEPLDPLCLFTAPDKCRARPKLKILGDNPVRIHVLTRKERNFKSKDAQDQRELRHYEDAGASCSDAVDETSRDVVTMRDVDLARPGVYHFHYECYNRLGLAAVPATRAIIVYGRTDDDGFAATPAPTPSANFQVDGAVQLSGYTPTTFGEAQRDAFLSSLAEEFAVAPYNVHITKVTGGGDFNARRRLAAAVVAMKAAPHLQWDSATEKRIRGSSHMKLPPRPPTQQQQQQRHGPTSVHVFFQIEHMSPRAADAIAGHLNAPSFADELSFELQKHGLSVPKLRLEAQSVSSYHAPHEATLWLGWVSRAKFVVAFGFVGVFVVVVAKAHKARKVRVAGGYTDIDDHGTVALAAGTEPDAASGSGEEEASQPVV